MSRRYWKHRITDILDSIKKIQKYVEEMEFEDFQKDEKTIDAVSEILLSSVKRPAYVPEDVSTGYSNIPWRVMGDMRNFAVHEYWGVELRTNLENHPRRSPTACTQFETSYRFRKRRSGIRIDHPGCVYTPDHYQKRRVSHMRLFFLGLGRPAFQAVVKRWGRS